MTRNSLLAAGTATLALLAAAPALAATQTLPYEGYEPTAEPEVYGTPVFTSDPVVQGAAPEDYVFAEPAPAPEPIPEPAPVYVEPAPVYAEPEPMVAPPVVAPPVAYAPAPAPVAPAYSGHRAYPAQAHHAAPYAYPAPYPMHAGYADRIPADFDRAAWLDDCRDQYRRTSRRERGTLIGGLLGAITGGIIGNRVADGERLGGTLIGGGLGGIAGAAVGSAIGEGKDRRAVDECEYYLDRYTSGYGYPGYDQTYPQRAYGYAYPQQYYVQVLVPVPQRAVVREYVTEEWVEEPAIYYETETVVEHQPTKRVRYVKQAPAPTKRTKYVKSK